MNVTLLGWRPLDFPTDRGEQIKGIQSYVAFTENGVTGQMTEKLFFKDGMKLPELTPGMTLDVSFNRKGKPEKVAAVPTSQRLNLGKQ